MIDVAVALGILAKCARYAYALGRQDLFPDKDYTDLEEIDLFRAFLQGVGRPAVPERCDPAAGTHVTPHVGCILR